MWTDPKNALDGQVPQVNTSEQIQVVVTWDPPSPERTDRHDWKHYLPAITLAGGKNIPFTGRARLIRTRLIRSST